MNENTAGYLWRAETWLLVTVVVYFLMNGAQHFAPRIIAFQAADPAHPLPQLTKKVIAWRRLNYIRVTALVLLAICQLVALKHLQM